MSYPSLKNQQQSNEFLYWHLQKSCKYFISLALTYFFDFSSNLWVLYLTNDYFMLEVSFKAIALCEYFVRMSNFLLWYCYFPFIFCFFEVCLFWQGWYSIAATSTWNFLAYDIQSKHSNDLIIFGHVVLNRLCLLIKRNIFFIQL